MRIEILGMGCARCKTLYENVKKAVEETGIEAHILKVDDINKITEYGVLSAPALAIDGEIKASGRTLEVEEIKKWISR